MLRQQEECTSTTPATPGGDRSRPLDTLAQVLGPLALPWRIFLEQCTVMVEPLLTPEERHVLRDHTRRLFSQPAPLSPHGATREPDAHGDSEP